MLRQIKTYLLRKTLIVRIIGVAILIFVPIWLGVLLPDIIAIPDDYSSESEMVGSMKMLNETTYEMDDIPLSIRSTTRTLHATDDEITLESEMAIINADTGEHLTDFEGPPEEHTIDRHTLEYTDDVHQGRYGFPIGIEKGREYDWWNSFINRTSDVTYVREEEHEGMRTYRHEIREDNITMGPGPIEGTTMYYSTLITLWLDPVTGLPVDIEQYQWRYLSFPDMRQIPDDQFEPDPLEPMLTLDGTISIINESTLELETAEVTIEGWIRYEGAIRDGEILKLNQTVRIIDRETGALFQSPYLDNPSSVRFGVDKKTCEYVTILGYSTDERTGQFILPVGQIIDPDTGAPKNSFRVWDDYLGAEATATLASDEYVERQGIECAVYTIDVTGQLEPMEVKGYTLDVYYESHTTRYVEPETGLTVDEEYSQVRRIQFPDLREIPVPLGKNNLSDPDVVMTGELSIINASTFEYDTYDIEVKAVLRDDGLIQDDRILKLNQTLYIYDQATGELLSDPNVPNPSSVQFAVDRETTEYVYVDGYSHDHRSGHFIFPIGILDENGEPIPKCTMWDSDLGAQVEAKLVSPQSKRIDGIECYQYIKHMKGPMPDMEVEGYTLTVELDATEVLWVEPNTGLTVDSTYDATRLITFPDLRWIPYPTGNGDPADPDVVMNGSLSLIDEDTLEYTNYSIRIEASIRSDGLWDRDRVMLMNQSIRIIDESTGQLLESEYIDNPSYAQFGVNRITTNYVHVPGYSDSVRTGHFIFPLGILDEHGEPLQEVRMWDDYLGEQSTAVLASPIMEEVEGIMCYRYEMHSVGMLEPMVVQGYTIEQELDNLQISWIEPNTGLSVDSRMIQYRNLKFPDVAKIPTSIGNGDPTDPDQVQLAQVSVVNIDGITYTDVPHDEYNLRIEVTMRTDCLVNISGSHVTDITNPQVVSWSEAEMIGAIDLELLCLNVTQRRYDIATGELVEHDMIDAVVSEQYGIDRKTAEFVYVPGYSTDDRTGHLVFPIGQVYNRVTGQPLQSLTMWDATLNYGAGKEVIAELVSDELVTYEGLECYVYRVHSFGYLESMEIMGFEIKMTQETNQTIYVEKNTGMSVNTFTEQTMNALVPDIHMIPPEYETTMELNGIMLHDLPAVIELGEADEPQYLYANANVSNHGVTDTAAGSAIQFMIDANVYDRETDEYLDSYSYEQYFGVLRDDSSYVNIPGWTQDDMADAWGQFVFPVCIFEDDWRTPMPTFEFWDQDLQTTMTADFQPPIGTDGYWDPEPGYPIQWYYNDSAPDQDVAIPPDGFSAPWRWGDTWYYYLDDEFLILDLCETNPNLFNLTIGNETMPVALYVTDQSLEEYDTPVTYESILGYEIKTTHKEYYKEVFVDPYTGLTVFSRLSQVEWYDWPMDGDDLEPWLWRYLYDPPAVVPRYIRELRDLGRYMPWSEDVLLGGQLDYSLDNSTLEAGVADIENNSKYIVYSSDTLVGAEIRIRDDASYRTENAAEIANNSKRIVYSERTIHGVNITYYPEPTYNTANLDSIRENSKYIVYSESQIVGAQINYTPRPDPDALDDIIKNRRGLRLTSQPRALVADMYVRNSPATVDASIEGIKEMQNLIWLGETLLPTLLFIAGVVVIFASDIRPTVRTIRRKLQERAKRAYDQVSEQMTKGVEDFKHLVGADGEPASGARFSPFSGMDTPPGSVGPYAPPGPGATGATSASSVPIIAAKPYRDAYDHFQTRPGPIGRGTRLDPLAQLATTTRDPSQQQRLAAGPRAQPDLLPPGRSAGPGTILAAGRGSGRGSGRIPPNREGTEGTEGTEPKKPKKGGSVQDEQLIFPGAPRTVPDRERRDRDIGAHANETVIRSLAQLPDPQMERSTLARMNRPAARRGSDDQPQPGSNANTDELRSLLDDMKRLTGSDAEPSSSRSQDLGAVLRSIKDRPDAKAETESHGND